MNLINKISSRIDFVNPTESHVTNPYTGARGYESRAHGPYQHPHFTGGNDNIYTFYDVALLISENPFSIPSQKSILLGHYGNPAFNSNYHNLGVTFPTWGVLHVYKKIGNDWVLVFAKGSQSGEQNSYPSLEQGCEYKAAWTAEVVGQPQTKLAGELVFSVN